MGLFQTGQFKLAAGGESRWKIECDALTEDDWNALALMWTESYPEPFGRVEGVPRGGVPFAAALRKYATGREVNGLLVAEDVVTTGRTATAFLATLAGCRFWGGGGVKAACVFTRGPRPNWAHPVFRMHVSPREAN